MLRSLCLLLLTSTFCSAAPLQVYILTGQSNMEGHAHVRTVDYLKEDPKTAWLHEAIKNEDGSFKEVDRVWISYLTGIRGDEQVVSGPLKAGFGSQGQPGEKIGPELAFGITLRKELPKEQPILLIKCAWGGQSLNVDFRSPSSGPYPKTEANAKRFDTPEKRQELEEKTGRRYRQLVEHVKKVLADAGRVVPGYDAKEGYELAGCVWFQGWNDMVDSTTYPNRGEDGGYDKYSEWMANFIRDVRRDLDAPKLPFVIGVMGVNGPIENLEPRYQKIHSSFREAMAAPAQLPEFHGNVVAVRTAPFWDLKVDAIDKKRGEIRGKAFALRKKNPNHENADGSMSEDDIRKFMAAYEKKLITEEELALEQRAKSNAAYHYLGSAKIYSQIGEAFARAVLELQE